MQENKKRRDSTNVGDRIESDSCGYYIIKSKSEGFCVVEFDTGYTCTVSNKAARRGSIKDPLYPQVLGVGYFGVGPYKNRLGATSKGFCTLSEYNAWQNMLQRCYYDKYTCRVDGVKTYDNVEVVPEWHNFQNFAEWYVPRRKLFDDNNIKRPALDKDILAPSLENRVYGPETCCLVPDEINGALVGIHKDDSGIMKQTKGFCVYYKSKRVTDYFDNIEEARKVREIIKQENFIRLANKYQHVIEPRVYDRLCNWFS